MDVATFVFLLSRASSISAGVYASKEGDQEKGCLVNSNPKYGQLLQLRKFEPTSHTKIDVEIEEEQTWNEHDQCLIKTCSKASSYG